MRCHGGEEGIAGGVDLSGGWTEHFNISYETLTNRCETQLTAYWIAGIDCMNGTALWSSQIFPPRSHGSGAAPLAKQLMSGHDGRIGELTRPERDLLFAWIDTNGLYYGTWNRTASGCAIQNWSAMQQALTDEMRSAGCLECHGQNGQLVYFENDWVNLEHPQYSRILRAPLVDHGRGHGLAWCRQRQVTPDRQRIHLLWNGYAHAVQPPEAFARHERVQPDREGEPVVSFASVDDPHYQAMLRIIRDARETTLAVARVDMPGAEVLAGGCRQFCPPACGRRSAGLARRGERWGCGAADVAAVGQHDRPAIRTASFARGGLRAHGIDARGADAALRIHRLAISAGYPILRCGECVARTTRRTELRVGGGAGGCVTCRTGDMRVAAASGVVHLDWAAPPGPVAGYHVYRREADTSQFEQLTMEPVRRSEFSDLQVAPQRRYTYVVRAVSRRNTLGEASAEVEATAHVVLPPVCTVVLHDVPRAELLDDGALPGVLHDGATISEDTVDLRQAGYVTIPHDACFELAQPLTVECRVRFDQPGTMPVVLSCGAWNQAGWFIQRLGNAWRWHVGGVDCDGGTAGHRTLDTPCRNI